MSAHRDTGAERPPRRRMVPSVGLQLLSPPCTPSVSPSGQGRSRRWLRERPSNLVGLGAGGGSGPSSQPHIFRNIPGSTSARSPSAQLRVKPLSVRTSRAFPSNLLFRGFRSPVSYSKRRCHLPSLRSPVAGPDLPFSYATPFENLGSFPQARRKSREELGLLLA